MHDSFFTFAINTNNLLINFFHLFFFLLLLPIFFIFFILIFLFLLFLYNLILYNLIPFLLFCFFLIIFLILLIYIIISFSSCFSSSISRFQSPLTWPYIDNLKRRLLPTKLPDNSNVTKTHVRSDTRHC